jgi:hypothetical protein
VFLEYGDDHKVAAAQLGESAGQILNNFFGEAQDIVNESVGTGKDSVSIANSATLPDGSVKLAWQLVKNKTSGTTYAYERGNTILVLSTLCDEAACSAFAETFSHIASTYKVP